MGMDVARKVPDRVGAVPWRYLGTTQHLTHVLVERLGLAETCALHRELAAVYSDAVDTGDRRTEERAGDDLRGYGG
jgi:hypothetical protein